MPKQVGKAPGGFFSGLKDAAAMSANDKKNPMKKHPHVSNMPIPKGSRRAALQVKPPAKVAKAPAKKKAKK